MSYSESEGRIKEMLLRNVEAFLRRERVGTGGR